MPQGQVLEFSGATKRFGGVTAVSDFTARVEPGVVTGFLGPNGAGKTTSLRMLLGLVRPTAGTATIDGARYAQLKNPLQTVGAVLEASSFHPGRTGAGHLTVYANAARIPKARVDEVLGLVGLSDAAGRKVGGYSLGMRQRLGLAYALLGDPGVLVLDEPTNGLDPEGIRWIRGFLRQLAREGRTVFVSSHLLAEVQQTVDALLIIAAGRLVFQGSLEELADPAEQATVVDSADRAALAEALRAAGIPFEVLRSGLTVRGIEPVAVGLAAAAAGVPLSSLHKRGPALEEVFLDLVNGTRVHASASGARHDDVIPAIESGAIPVIAAAEGDTDAAADEGAGAAPEAGAGVETGAGADAAGAEELPEADAAATESVAEELDAMGAAPAAVLGTAAGVAWAQADAAEDGPGDHDAGEPTTHTASFAVASTGVIDVIPPASAEDEPEGDAGTGEDSDGAGEDAAADPAPSEEEPALPETAEAGTEADAGEESDEAPAEDAGEEADGFSDGPDDPDRTWDEYVKTDADVEADRFFAAFDSEAEHAGSADDASDAAPDADTTPGADEDAASENGGDAASDPPPSDGPPPGSPHAPDEGGHSGDGQHDHDGGEHR